jgi:hypothetical protein
VKGTVGPRFWTIVAFAGVLFGWAAHLSPFTEQPPSYILSAYNHRLAGWVALGVLLVLMLVMSVAGVYAAYLWRREVQRSHRDLRNANKSVEAKAASQPIRERRRPISAVRFLRRHNPDVRRHRIPVAWLTDRPNMHLRSGVMALDKPLMEIERKLWSNDAAFYQDTLIGGALLVFPETGVITRDVAVEAILAENAEGRRWAEVQFAEVHHVPLAEDVTLVTYRVDARWAHKESKRSALASSVYVKRDGRWKLAFHQQTPLDGS